MQTSSILKFEGVKLPETHAPLNGILTLRNRNVDISSWTCLLCQETNGSLWSYCKACHRDRKLDWLKDMQQHNIQPGVVITFDDVEVGMVTKVIRLPPQVEVYFYIPPEMPAVDDSDEENEENKRNTNLNRPTTSSSQRTASRGKDVKTKEQEREIALEKERKKYRKMKPIPPANLEKRIIAGELLRKHKIVNDERIDLFLSFGLCGLCERVYRIPLGPCFLLDDDDRSLLRIKVTKQEHELNQMLDRKSRYRKMQRKNDIFELNKSIASLRKEINDNKKQMQPVCIYCPFCTWKPTY